VPGPLDARTVNHSVFAQQAALLVPLAANAVRQPVLVGFFRGEHSVLVPGAMHTVSATISQWDFLAKQPCSIKVSLDNGVHHTSACIRPTSPPSGLVVH